MEPKITPTGATLGALVTDIDLAELDDPTWAIVESAFQEYGVLIFPDQNLSEEKQIDFATRFGSIEYLAPNAKSVLISNQEVDGSLHEGGEYSAQMLRGNEGWHSDSSFMPLAAKASVLSAQVVPPEGGQTEWADMRASYDALDDDIREKIADLAAYHSIYFSQARIGHHVEPGTGYGFHREPPPLRPLVKVHPETGRNSLFIGRHAYGIPGLDEAASETLLADLTAFACQPPHLSPRLGSGRCRYLGQPVCTTPISSLRLFRGPSDAAHSNRRRSEIGDGVEYDVGIEYQCPWLSRPLRCREQPHGAPRAHAHVSMHYF